MAIRPIKFNDDGSIEIWHDEFGHGGTISEKDINHAKDEKGNEDERFLVLECPVLGCNSYSVHPVSGGVDPKNIQELFVRKHMTDKKMDRVAAIASLQKRSEKLDSGRWKINS
jgi:hypothetical protein